jgi:hypothetical protein
MDDFMKGLITASSELGKPFVEEAIWTEAITDLFVRGGRTREGNQVFNPEDTEGNKIMAGIKHLVETQAPFSYPQFKRLDLASEPIDIIEKGKYDKYGQSYELKDELLGFTGFRPVNLNVERGLNFKVAEFQKGVRESRQLFTRNTLRGGPVTPEEIVDAYINANRAIFGVKKDLYKDLKAAEILNTPKQKVNKIVAERISQNEYNNLNLGVFIPYTISEDVQKTFAENAAKIGQPNPLISANPIISNIQRTLSRVPLTEENIPEIENPFKNLAEPTLEPVSSLPSLPNPTQIPGYGQINLPTAVAGNQVNPVTRLTPVEQALLSPTEQAIRQKQRTT